MKNLGRADKDALFDSGEHAVVAIDLPPILPKTLETSTGKSDPPAR